MSSAGWIPLVKVCLTALSTDLGLEIPPFNGGNLIVPRLSLQNEVLIVSNNGEHGSEFGFSLQRIAANEGNSGFSLDIFGNSFFLFKGTRGNEQFGKE